MRGCPRGDERDLDVLETGVGSAGAVVTGRRNFEHALPWWGADGPTGAVRLPVFVVCSEVPADVPDGGVYVFVTDGIESALKQAAEAAGDRVVCVMGGAETALQLPGRGPGRRVVDPPGARCCSGAAPASSTASTSASTATLEPVSVVQTQAATHLRYRIVR